MLLAPSILAADFGRLEAHAQEALNAGGSWLHVDVMDGHFVPNISMGPLVVRALRPLCQHTGALLDVHLMIEHPEQYIEAFATAGADIITVHVEACQDLCVTVKDIKQRGIKAGITLNPATSLNTLEKALPLADLVLVMSVVPGFGSQTYIPGSTAKIRKLRQRLSATDSAAYLEVDGGINSSNAREVVEAGADVLVAGSAIFHGSVWDNVNDILTAAEKRL